VDFRQNIKNRWKRHRSSKRQFKVERKVHFGGEQNSLAVIRHVQGIVYLAFCNVAQTPPGGHCWNEREM